MAKFFYNATKSDFVETIENSIDYFIDEMKKGAKSCGVIVGEREIISWKENAKVLSPLLSKSNIPDDVVIAFEYQIPIGGGRIDCMLFGEDKFGKKNIIHIELKQWSNDSVETYYDHYSFLAEVAVEGYKSGTKITSHPLEQVSGYDNILLNHVKAFDELNISLHGCAFCYNYIADKGKCALLDEFYSDLMKKYPLYCKNQTDDFATYLKELLGSGKGEDIFNVFINSEIGTTKRLYDVAANMLEGAKEFELVGEQIDVYNAILGAVKNTKADEKTAIIVKGGPGTGKSVIAMRLLSELYKEEYHCNNVYYATRSSSLRDGWKNILKSVARRFGHGDASSLIQSTYDFKPYRYGNKENGGDVLIVDEAHRISNKSNDQTDSHRDEKDRSYLPQILSMLYTSRVCVFFIDDKQSIVSTEIGLSSNIELAAKHYWDYINKANAIYLGKIQEPKDDPILKEIKVRKDLEFQLEKAKKKNNEKEIDSITRFLRLPIIEPQIKSVSVISFELKDQFRCNGSNNYLDWIDQILYESNSPNKVKLNLDSYEFDIFDNPNDLYSQIRSLDSYAVCADNFKKGMGDMFSYKALHDYTEKMTFNQCARLIAGWCWDWNEKTQICDETGDLKCEVDLSEEYNFSMPWETKRIPKGDYKYKYAKNADSWCNKKEGVNQIGCIHSIQGWETDYIGVIIGPDLKWDDKNQCLCYNPNGNNHNLSKKEGYINNQLILNTYRVLLTRGKKGCFIFACDPGVRDYFKRCMKS